MPASRFLLLGVLGILIFDAIWLRVGLGAAIVVVCGGLLLFAWNTDRKDQAQPAPGSTSFRPSEPATAPLRRSSLLSGGRRLRAGAETEPTRRTATVARVGDGDTLDLRTGARVRLVQIDAPELGEGECYARESRASSSDSRRPESRSSSSPIRSSTTPTATAACFATSTSADANVNVELVRRGAATPYFRGGDEGTYADELLDAVDEAPRCEPGHVGLVPGLVEPGRGLSPLVRGRASLGRGTFVGGTQTFGAATLDLKRALRRADDAEL